MMSNVFNPFAFNVIDYIMLNLTGLRSIKFTFFSFFVEIIYIFPPSCEMYCSMSN